MGFDLQTLVAILTALLVFATGIFLRYDQIQLRQYTLPIPQWVGLSLALVSFFFVAADQVLRGLVRLEEIQRRDEEAQHRSREEARRVAQEREEAQRRDEEARYRSREEARRVAQEREEAERRSREETFRAEEAERRSREEAFRAEEAERAARRARVQARCLAAQLRYQLAASPAHRRELAAVLAFLQEYGDTL